MKLWIVGEVVNEVPGWGWGIVGVYDTQAAAVAACYHRECFLWETELNKTAPESKQTMPGAYYPLAEAEE